MGNLLVTPTLLDSFEFAKNAPPSWKARAMKDFVGKIKREKMTFPAWVKKGIAFEDTIYRVCRKATYMGQNEVTQGSDIFRETANICLGGTFQAVSKKTIVLDDQEVLFYNKMDVVKDDEVLDIKTTLKWKGEDKYLNKWQHKLYLWSTGKKRFTYLVLAWENEHTDALKSLDIIPWVIEDPAQLESMIIDGVEKLFSFIRHLDLWEDYYHTFSNNRR